MGAYGYGAERFEMKQISGYLKILQCVKLTGQKLKHATALNCLVIMVRNFTPCGASSSKYFRNVSLA